MLFRVCEVIVGYFWLLKVISPYVIINNFRLYYHRLFVVILLWLLMAIVAIHDYSINCYFIDGY
jgi:hypothetical protein